MSGNSPLLVLAIGRIDDLGRPLVRLVEQDQDNYSPGAKPSWRISDETFVIDPDPVYFDPEDRGTVRRPLSSQEAERLFPVSASELLKLETIPSSSGLPRRKTISPVQPLPHLHEGDLLLLKDSLGWPEDGKILIRFAAGVERIRSLRGNEQYLQQEINRWYTRAKGEGGAGPFLSNEFVLHFEADAERARHEPDEALVLSWTPEDDRRNRAWGRSEVICHRGPYVFHGRDDGMDPSDVGLGPVPKPGLWLTRKMKFWESRDHESGHVEDYGMNCTWEAVTPAQAAEHFGITEDELMQRLEQAYPFQHDLPLLDAIHQAPGEPKPEDEAEDAEAAEAEESESLEP